MSTTNSNQPPTPTPHIDRKQHTTRDRQWTYHLDDTGRRVMAVTHNPSGRTLPLDPYGDSLTIAYRRIRHGVYLARLDGRAVCEYGHR